MKVVSDLLGDDDWDVHDVAVDRRGYDLLAIRNGQELHVGVKGTTGAGASVLLTRGEVRHVREHSSQVALGVVSGIALRQEGEQWHGDGGQARMFWPWRLDDSVLEPVGFEWVLPPAGEVPNPG
jgi:hypothetical protein